MLKKISFKIKVILLIVFSVIGIGIIVFEGFSNIKYKNLSTEKSNIEENKSKIKASNDQLKQSEEKNNTEILKQLEVKDNNDILKQKEAQIQLENHQKELQKSKMN